MPFAKQSSHYSLTLTALVSCEEKAPTLFNAPWILRDGGSGKEPRGNPKYNGLLFHLKADDYFGTLATILAAIYEETKSGHPDSLEFLTKVRDDLTFLHDHYTIRKKTPRDQVKRHHRS